MEAEIEIDVDSFGRCEDDCTLAVIRGFRELDWCQFLQQAHSSIRVSYRTRPICKTQISSAGLWHMHIRVLHW